MTTPIILSRDEARDLAARTLAAIDELTEGAVREGYGFVIDADRERVASDLAGIEECLSPRGLIPARNRDHAARYAAGLVRTAALYGEKPRDASLLPNCPTVKTNWGGRLP